MPGLAPLEKGGFGSQQWSLKTKQIVIVKYKEILILLGQKGSCTSYSWSIAAEESSSTGTQRGSIADPY